MTTTLGLTAAWERDIVAHDGDATALILTISAATGERPTDRAPLDIAFALDRSGSMTGPPLDLVKEAVAAATHHLGVSDRVALVTFDQEVEVLHDLRPATTDRKDRLRRVLREIQPGGSTNLGGGWLTACQQLAMNEPQDARRSLQRALLLTDGLANTGITAPDELATHAGELRARGIATTTIGVGRHFDEFLLEAMAEAGGGHFQYIATPDELRGFFETEIGDLLDIVAIRPQLVITFPEGVHATLLNPFPVQRDGRAFTVDLRDLASGDKVPLVFETAIKPGPHGPLNAPTVTLEWTSAETGDAMGTHRNAPALTRADRHVRDAYPRNDAAASTAALIRNARDQREAIRLDREGRFAESRDRFRHAAANLAAAPMTIEVQEELAMNQRLAAMDEAPFDEHIRKQRVFQSHSRTRGSRRRP